MPKCSLCDGVMKMDVILFGETMPSSTLQDAMQAAALADVLLVIGTSLKVGILVCSREDAQKYQILCDHSNGLSLKHADLLLYKIFCGRYHLPT